MREYEFRGKLKNDINRQKQAGSWVYGGYYYWKHGACVHEENAAVGLFVDSETVGQYTGLKDKNGIKIFEGDVVKEADGKCWEAQYADAEYWARHRVNSLASEYIRLSRFDKESIEVIGNIYDNGELLKVEGGQ